MADAALGKVYAPDPDDWDNKTYTLETSAAKYFSLNQSSGVMTVKPNTPAGSYWLRVGVSDGVWPDVFSGVRVHVRELEEKSILSSASLRLTGITAREFIDSHVEGKSRLETFWDFLSETLSVRTGCVNIFSIADREERTVDIHFYVLTDNGYLRPEKLHSVLTAHKKKLQSLLRANVSQVQVDECVRTDCKTAGGCSTRLSIADTPTLVDSGALSLVSVKVTPSAVCGCAARETTHLPCFSYPISPCLNGGTCVDTQSGYRPCFDSHLSLEFMTERDDGLLLYAGPSATLLPGDGEDYMAIELIGGTPSLKINHGSGTLVLQLTNNVGVTDRRWHRLDVRSNSKLYDLGSPAESSNTVAGCSLIDDHCNSMERLSSCGKRGRCLGEWGPSGCLCEPGFAGPQCDQAAPEFSFDGRSHMQFQLLWSLPAREMRVQVGVRTHATVGVILSLLSQKQNEYLRLEVIQGLLAVLYNLGDGDYNLTLPYHRLGDGEWHEVELDRCPQGHMTKQSSLGTACVYTLCASRPCRHGTCVAHSPSRYTCRCSEGYRGRHCEATLAMFHNEDGNSLSLSSMFAISICVLAFLGSYVDYVLFYLW
ncbi:Neural-cadherin [Liparis tanakae]|uniref:Neural-cadherin n=1 Tax=Liparis tanakae TaxID=230148 RepID=A0A4Z2HQG2_9TELE|nr:Neural-cadherin [Liparis tanakae]